MATETVNGVEVDVTECQKLTAVSEESQAQGEFVDWLQETKGLVLARWENKIERACEAAQSAYVDVDVAPGHVVRRYRKCVGGKVFLRRRPWDDEDEVDTGETCERCGGEGFVVEDRAEPILVPAEQRLEALLAEYHQVDLAKVEAERRALLEALRA